MPSASYLVPIEVQTLIRCVRSHLVHFDLRRKSLQLSRRVIQHLDFMSDLPCLTPLRRMERNQFMWSPFREALHTILWKHYTLAIYDSIRF